MIVLLPKNKHLCVDPNSCQSELSGTGCFERQGVFHLCLLPDFDSLASLKRASLVFACPVHLSSSSGNSPWFFPRRSIPIPSPVASVGLSVKMLCPELSKSLITASDAGREPERTVTLEGLYLHIAKVGIFLLDQRLTSVLHKALGCKYFRL